MSLNDSFIENALAPFLEPGEQLLWKGMPKQGVMLSKADYFVIPFSLFWGGFAIFWEIMVITMGAPWIMVIFGIPFVLIGLYLMVGRFFFDARRRKNTYYGLSHNRIVILSGVKSPRADSYFLSELKDLSVSENPDGIGTVLLGKDKPGAKMMRGTSWPGAKSSLAPALESIPEATKVLKVIVALQKAN